MEYLETKVDILRGMLKGIKYLMSLIENDGNAFNVYMENAEEGDLEDPREACSQWHELFRCSKCPCHDICAEYDLDNMAERYNNYAQHIPILEQAIEELEQ